MTNLHEKLTAAAGHLRLSADEKRAMRAALERAMRPEPAAPRPVRSPYTFFSFSNKWAVALASLVIVVGAGGGTAYAAQGSLPGSPLYPLKVNVIEPMQVALAPTAEAKAQVEVALADRRVAEAQTLAARGALDEATAEELSANFEAHASQALALVPAQDGTATVSGMSAEPAGAVSEQSTSTQAQGAGTGASDSDEPGMADGPHAAITLSFGAAGSHEASSTSPQTNSISRKTMATSTDTEQSPSSDKREDSHSILRASLRAKAEVLQELKFQASERTHAAADSREEDN